MKQWNNPKGDESQTGSIVVIFNDGCTAGLYTWLDTAGWVSAEDGQAYAHMFDGAVWWCDAPADFEPYFMTLTGD